MTVNYNTDVSTVKVEVFYTRETVGKYGGTVDAAVGYDTKIENDCKIYDTSRMGLHTDKTAEAVSALFCRFTHKLQPIKHSM